MLHARGLAGGPANPGRCAGHYVALIKSAGVWLLYEDDAVEPVSESTVQQTFGAASDFLVRSLVDSSEGGSS